MTELQLAAPFAGVFRLSQGWGSNAAYYGRFAYDGAKLLGHNGLDFALPVGTPLLATDAGDVMWIGFEEGGFGHYVKLRHAWGESLYAHLARVPLMERGQWVERGQPIGASGNSGGSTGPHLHFGIRLNPHRRGDGWGGFSDPLAYLDPDCYTMGRGLDDDADLPSPVGWTDWGRP